MRMFKPHKTQLKRIFHPGLWLCYQMSQHRMQLHSKVYRLQVLFLVIVVAYLLCDVKVNVKVQSVWHVAGLCKEADGIRVLFEVDETLSDSRHTVLDMVPIPYCEENGAWGEVLPAVKY